MEDSIVEGCGGLNSYLRGKKSLFFVWSWCDFI